MRKALVLLVVLLPACGLDFSGNVSGDAGEDGAAPSPTPEGDASSPPKKKDASAPPLVDASELSDASPPPPPQGTPALAMLSGDGATISANWQGGDPLRVRATAGGVAVVGAKVTFALTSGNSVHLQAPNGEVTTDGDGVAAISLNAFGIQPWLGWDTNVVTASWSGKTVAFSVIVTAVPQGSSPQPPLIQFNAPDGNHNLGAAKAGSILPGAIVALGVLQQGPSQGQPLPGWGFRLTDSLDPLAPSPVACVGGTVIADGKGTIRCDVKVPSVPGSYVFGLFAAGQTKWSDGHLTAN